MTEFSSSCSVVSLPDIELQAQISCASRRLIVISPGLSESVAVVLAGKWRELGPIAVQVVLDADPEVCRLGYGDLAALKLLHETADQLGTCIHKQHGLRVGVVISDETTTVYSPVPRLVEAGGEPGERLNALRFEAPIIQPNSDNAAADLREINLEPVQIESVDVQTTEQDLTANPPMKFDLARKVRVFNARFEFVEFELRGLSLSRKRVRIPSDLIGLAKDPKAQKLLHSSFQLIDKNNELSGERAFKYKQKIVMDYLVSLPGFGSVVLRTNKPKFERKVKALERYVRLYQRLVKKQLQNAIDANRELLIAALLPAVVNSPPARWRRFIGTEPGQEDVKRMLRHDLVEAFGKADDLLEEMQVKVLFKGVTYESLNDPEFIRIAKEKIPSLEDTHEEYDAAKAQAHSA